jgi:fumarylacetoacetase
MDIQVSASVRSRSMRDQGATEGRISHSSASKLYWTIYQMLAHHAANGCNFRSGDLFGTGTISASDPRHSGCLLEVTANGGKPIELASGEMRTFLEDGDEVSLAAFCERAGFRRIGFGECRGTVLPPA